MLQKEKKWVELLFFAPPKLGNAVEPVEYGARTTK